MLTTALVRLVPQRPVRPAALRLLLRAARHARGLAGFRRWQTFRALDASDAILILVDWDTPEALRAALSDPVLQSFLGAGAAWAGFPDPPAVLSPDFERKLVRRESVGTLLRVAAIARPARGAGARDSEFTLRALAAPGSTRLSGARTAAGTLSACRIDFDTEDGLWHFLESPLRAEWTRRAVKEGEKETWGLNLPRLEYRRAAERPAIRKPRPPRRETLSVELSVSEDRQCAHVRLEGCIDQRQSRLSERFCRALIENGCRRLEVDVSGLSSISAEGLGMLTRTARAVKERGGQFVLIDNEARVARVTRSKHLTGSLR